jgi:hypothetical protein
MLWILLVWTLLAAFVGRGLGRVVRLAPPLRRDEAEDSDGEERPGATT